MLINIIRNNTLELVILILSFSLVSSCRSIPQRIIIPDNVKEPKDIVILVDGTSNTPTDNTNINKLRRLTKNRNNLISYYTVGVGGGPDFAITGMALGVGISKDVIEAYQFISSEYSKKDVQDNIYLFGFSRGAYTCQILSNLIYTAGLIDLDIINEDKEKKKLLRKIYRAYLGDRTFTERKRKVNKVIEKWELENNINLRRRDNIVIEVLGLFDNVEALAAPDYKEKFCNPNPNHLNQFVNVKKVLHAVSLDDNRAQIFTPILATCSNIKLRRGADLNNLVNEVWFSGAHSDVGGGYSDNYEISYVSLNWMINELNEYDIFHNVPITDFHINSDIHDSEDNFIGAIYRRRNRDIPLYLFENGEHYNNGKLKIHSSVIKRLERGLIPKFKKSRKDSLDWFDKDPFKKCFDSIGDKRILRDDCNFIEVVHR